METGCSIDAQSTPPLGAVYGGDGAVAEVSKVPHPGLSVTEISEADPGHPRCHASDDPGLPPVAVYLLA